MEKFHQKPEYNNEEAQRREEIQRLRQKLEEAMEHIEDEFSLQQISELTAQLDKIGPGKIECRRRGNRLNYVERNKQKKNFSENITLWQRNRDVGNRIASVKEPVKEN